MKKYLSIFLVVAMVCAMFNLPASASGYTMSVNESQVTKISDGAMFGINTDWSVSGNGKYVNDIDNNDFSPRNGVKAAFSNTKLPVIRLGESASQEVLWKSIIGDFSDRAEYTLWSSTGIIKFGLVEKIKYFQEIDPDVEFIITVNMNDTAQNAADLAEFLTGGAGTVWGAKRIEYGIANPVKVKMYQLGNENDRGDDAMTAQEYVSKGASVAAAIKSKDSTASIGVIGGTSLYTRYVNDGSYDDTWLKAVVSGLEEYVDYVTFNWYFAAASTYKIDQLLGRVKNSINQAIGANSVKICFTEFAEAVYGEPATVPTSLDGVLNTADFYIRSYLNPDIEIAAYHAFSSSSWQTIWFNNNNDCGLTGIGMLQNLFKKYGIGNVVSSSLTGFSSGTAADVTGIAVSPAENKLNLIFTNRTSNEVTVNLDLPDGYKMYEESILKSTSSTPSLADMTNSAQNGINCNYYKYTDSKKIMSYTLPAYSVCAVGMERKPSNATVVYSEDFSSANISDFTSIISAEDGVGASIEGSSLLLDGYGDYGTTFADNYIYLPNDINLAKKFKLSAKITVNDYDDGAIGIIYKSSQADDFMSSGSGNIVLINGDGVSEKQYAAGAASSVKSNVTTNVPDLSSNPTFNFELNVDGENISFAIDGKTVYTRIDSTLNENGYMGIYFTDISVSVDDITVTAEKDDVELEKTFVYEENFDDVEDGRLPEGFDLTSGIASAYVENGALYVDNSEWYKMEGVIISEIGSVLTKDLTIEADITKISQVEAARQSSASNHGGFIFGADGKNKTTFGAHTYNNYLECRIPNISYLGTSAINYSNDETPFHEGGTVRLKIVCDNNATPFVYINGRHNSYTRQQQPINSEGFVGLFAMASKIKIDNLRITGKKAYIFAEDAVEEKNVEFTYSENFDDVSVNALPIGWTIVGTNAIAKVENDALSLYSADQYSAKYILFDFDDVYRHYGTSNLTMECDIVRNAKNGGSNSFAGAGLAYGVELNSDGTIKTSSFVSTNTEKKKTSPTTSQDYNKEYNIDVKDFETTVNRNYIIQSGSNPPAESFNWDSKQPVHLKIELTNDTQSPEIYINGSRIIDPWSSKITDNSEDRVLTGKIGLYFRNANVIIDNVVVSGTRKLNVPESVTYEAEFKKGNPIFASVKQAEADVVLSEVDFYGNKTDLTEYADISTVNVSENLYQTIVSYDKDLDGNDEYSQRLSWTLSYFDEDFLYSENFDTMENGTLPAGWTVVGAAATAQVEDNALRFSSLADWYKDSYILFDYENVLRNSGTSNLTMECDITRKTSVSNSNSAQSRVGFCYAVDYDNGTINSASYVAPKTQTQYKIGVQDFGTFGDQNYILASDGTHASQDFRWDTDTVHLKIELDDTTHSPIIYINNQGAIGDPWSSRKYSTSEDRILSGKIGLYAKNADVIIDNIVIKGTERKDAANDNNGINLTGLNYDSVNNSLNIGISGEQSGDQNLTIFAAVYDTLTNKLIELKSVEWDGKYKSIKTGTKIDGIDAFSDENNRVSLFAWKMPNMQPIGQKAE